MLEQKLEDATRLGAMNKDLYFDGLKKDKETRALRFTDMQQVVNTKLAMSQASVNNAENYPSTWTTNPDGGANGQV